MMIPQFETQALLLRQLQQSDVSELHGILSQTAVTDSLGRTPHCNLEQTRQLLSAHLHRQANGDEVFWGIAPREDNIIIGFCGLRNLNQAGSPELAFAIAKEFQGNGWMQTALQTVLQYATVQLKAEKIKVFLAAENAAAKHILQKLGFKGKPTREDPSREIWVKK